MEKVEANARVLTAMDEFAGEGAGEEAESERVKLPRLPSASLKRPRLAKSACACADDARARHRRTDTTDTTDTKFTSLACSPEKSTSLVGYGVFATLYGAEIHPGRDSSPFLPKTCAEAHGSGGKLVLVAD
jgi:hypothetical protein